MPVTLIFLPCHLQCSTTYHLVLESNTSVLICYTLDLLKFYVSFWHVSEKMDFFVCLGKMGEIGFSHDSCMQWVWMYFLMEWSIYVFG